MQNININSKAIIFLNWSPLRQNGSHCADDISDAFLWMKFGPEGLIDNYPTLL